MKISYGLGTTEEGPGVQIVLTGEDVANAILTWLVAHDVHIFGPRTIRVNKELCQSGYIYVDPSGKVMHKGEQWDGHGGPSPEDHKEELVARFKEMLDATSRVTVDDLFRLLD